MRFGIIGSGFITERFKKALSLASQAEISAVFSRSEDRARQSAQGWGARPFTDWKLFSQYPDIDAFYIASPTSLHHHQAVELLGRGKHVFCEKPLATNYREAREMFETAHNEKVVLFEGMRPLHHPGLSVIRSALPRLGRLRRASFSYCQYSSRYDRFREGIIENAFDPQFSNGATMDLGVYCVSVMSQLLGMPDSIVARSVKLHNGIEAEGAVIASYPGMQAQLGYSKISNSSLPCELQGEEGSLSFFPVAAPKSIYFVDRKQNREDLSVQASDDDMIYEIQDFLAITRNQELAEPYERASLATMKLLDSIRESSGIEFPGDQEHATLPT